MSTQFRTRFVGGAASILLGALVAGVSGAVPGQEAKAQGFFGMFFGNPGNSRPSYRDYRSAYAPSQDERFPFPNFSDRPERPSADAGRGSGTSCVRLCDGRHFPLPRAASSAALNPAKVCSALCPAAKTQVFHGSNMDYASASDGTRYADLDNAFVYREKIVPDCSCTGNGPGGLAQIDIESDPTLRAGDVVATASGLAVFKGSQQFPYKTADFTPVSDYGKVNSELRRKLSEIKVDPTATPAAPVQKLAEAADEKPAKPKPRKQRTRAVDNVGYAPMRFDSFFR